MRTFSKTEIVPFSEYSLYLQSTVRPSSSIKHDVAADKKKLGELCKLVCPSVKPKRENFKAIITAATKKCDIVLRHADKFYADARSASDAELFFKNIDVVRRDLGELRAIMQYVEYGGYSLGRGNEDSFYMPSRLQIEIRHLIDRVYDAVSAAPDPAKVASAQLAVFAAREGELDEQSQRKLVSKFKKYL